MLILGTSGDSIGYHMATKAELKPYTDRCGDGAKFSVGKHKGSGHLSACRIPGRDCSSLLEMLWYWHSSVRNRYTAERLDPQTQNLH